MKQLGIYIHIPFCKDKCYYCDFVSFKNMEQKANKYVECLIKEIESKDWNEINKNYKVTTIYIGGGTPSYIDFKYIVRILEVLHYLDKKDIEITIEVNPGTVNKEKLIAYKNAGVNRLSIGLQSTNNEILKQIGRIHTFEQFLETYKLAKEAGFENINIDLMLALPNQTIEDLKQSIEKVVELNPNHISVYSLILEEGTKLYNLVENGKAKLPDEETERQMYWYVKNKLELAGYTHYEISNFAKKGKESKHNMNCWNQEEYLGFGIAAHSYLESINFNKAYNFQKKDNTAEDKKMLRFSNTENLDEYISNISKIEEKGLKDDEIQNQINKNIEIHEFQTLEEKKKEYMLLGLRKIEGVSISKFKEKFVDNPIYLFRKELQKLTEEELIEIDGDFIKLTSKGLDFANIVWEEFV
ncbi:MAG: radical SAM family heme chaperone HemW [Clostridia bacterium]|nr:radical SAM family heme chaperone HemW [Clostridia bacterium]